MKEKSLEVVYLEFQWACDNVPHTKLLNKITV